MLISTHSEAKSKCEFEWNALKSVQSQLRHQSTEYLRDKERVKHQKYQDCRKGKNKTSTKVKAKKTYRYYAKNNNSYYKNTRNSFNNSPVTMKTKFKGEKQEAWLEYYRTPPECIKPKKTSVFATCLANRDEIAIKFDEIWESNKN